MSNIGHTFHIPVMGTGFTIDTPLRVARYGISSVISLVDDNLIEDMRRYHAQANGEAYTPILKYDRDWRARRITEYLNLVDRLVKKQFESLRQSAFEAGSEITKYFEMLPDESPLKVLYHSMLSAKEPAEKASLQSRLREQIFPGAINVNIMTKIDRANSDRAGEPLGEEFSDALAALRGYARSTLASAIVFSAGFNRRLYTYAEDFKDFYADAAGNIKKQIIIKVTDYRSAITQGKFFAKKGLWVSEYRIESGLNCGGHAFAGNGNLIGPILEEFRLKRQELVKQLSQICLESLKIKNRTIPERLAPFRLTAQGGIGTAMEDKFLRQYFHVDSTGWGSPFLLVREVTAMDDDTRVKLAAAKEKDVQLSDISPLGVPFWTLVNSLSEANKQALVKEGHCGSACPLGHLVSNTEFTPEPICTASRQYQTLKLTELKKSGVSGEEYQRRFDAITAKACICNDLGDGAYAAHGVAKKNGGIFTAVCPGPNIAYFSRQVSLKEMVDHIYGRANLMLDEARPHVLIKELQLNIAYFTRLFKQDPQSADLVEFRTTLVEGIRYYFTLIPQIVQESVQSRNIMLGQLKACAAQLEAMAPTPI
jgi:hypothetical protein